MVEFFRLSMRHYVHKKVENYGTNPFIVIKNHYRGSDFFYRRTLVLFYRRALRKSDKYCCNGRGTAGAQRQ